MSKKHNNRGGNNSKGNKAMKYMVRADIKVNGTVQRKDIIGAIMGQTEGLLGKITLENFHRDSVIPSFPDRIRRRRLPIVARVEIFFLL